MNASAIFRVAALATVSFATDLRADAPEPLLETRLTLHTDAASAGPALTTAAAPAQTSADPFAAGRWVVNFYGSGTWADDAGDFYQGHVGVGFHIVNNLSINLELVAGETDSDQEEFGAEDGWNAGFDLLLRWHFCRTGAWSIYVDGGAGMIWFDDAFPAGGTHQNFTPQLGLGITYQINENLMLMAGGRWHHVSNARKSGVDRNPGFDGGMLYLGVMLPF